VGIERGPGAKDRLEACGYIKWEVGRHLRRGQAGSFPYIKIACFDLSFGLLMMIQIEIRQILIQPR
jgi:hypothetical protein